MKVTELRKDGKKKAKMEGWFVNVSMEEALQLIASLTKQIQKNSPNCGRGELYTENGLYFSIAVDQHESIETIRRRLTKKQEEEWRVFKKEVTMVCECPHCKKESKKKKK